MSNEPLVIAVPKGRILDEALPIIRAVGIEPEPAFADEGSRKLMFETNRPGLKIIRVRSFDVATFVAFGGAQLGIAGNDVLMEFDYSEIYAPLDLAIGRCRLSLAQPKDLHESHSLDQLSHVRIATKYPHITRKWFADRGIQAECVKLNGAMELAPVLGLCPRIVDLVSSGNTLKANGLVEVETVAHVTSRLIVNRTALKVRAQEIGGWIDKFRAVVNGSAAPGSAPQRAAKG